MMQAAQKQGVRLFVNHQRRYGKPFKLMRDALSLLKINSLFSV